MTEDLIKQNAEKYASKLVERDYHEDMWLDLYDAHIAGAHSRNEEIEELQKDVHDFEQALACAEDVVDIQRKELDKLCNPWISVEERLPEMHEFKERDCTILHSDDILLASIHGVHFGCVWFEKGRYTFGGRKDAIKEEKWTHWMPIPEIEKGE